MTFHTGSRRKTMIHPPCHWLNIGADEWELTDTVVASLLVFEKFDVSEDSFAEVAVTPLDEDLGALYLRLHIFVLLACQHWTQNHLSIFMT